MRWDYFLRVSMVMNKGRKTIIWFMSVFLLISLCLSNLMAQQAGQQPAKVVVSEIKGGVIVPEAEFVGSVFYQEISDVASEVSGRVEDVNFEEGERVKEGHVLVRLGSELLQKSILSTNASYEQALSELEKAKTDLRRAEGLKGEELISEQTYDDYRFRVKGLEKRVASLKADVERLEVELEKKDIKAPFSGVVLKRIVDRGEWLSQGEAIATIARDDTVDIIVNAPESQIRHIRPGMDIRVISGGQEMTGKVFTIIPEGDISTRTIPVKVRVKNNFSLVQGMEARVFLPSGKEIDALMVPRDAIVNISGNNVVFTVSDSMARMIPVNITGYKGVLAGVQADGLSEGMKVVVKGNERLRDRQPVLITDDRREKNAD